MFLSPCHASGKQYHVFFFPLVEFICKHSFKVRSKCLNRLLSVSRPA